MSSFPNLEGERTGCVARVSADGKRHVDGERCGERHSARRLPGQETWRPQAKMLRRCPIASLAIRGLTTRRLSRGRSALGNIERDRSEYGQIPVEAALGRVSGTGGKGNEETGTENYGGPIVTAGGLLIIAATDFDRKIRAFNSRTGELLWEACFPSPEWPRRPLTWSMASSTS